MADSGKQTKKSGMERLATWIVDKRLLIFLLIGIMVAFSVVSRNWVSVENDLAAFLPSSSATRKGLDMMAEEFTTFGSAKVMVANITYDQAAQLADELAAVPGVQKVDFDDTTDHYNHVSALYELTFDYPEEDPRALQCLHDILDQYAVLDTFYSTTMGNRDAIIIDQEVQVITVIVAVIVVSVMLFTSQTFAEVLVMLITFVSAMLMNLGSNFLLGTISFVSNSVTSILQLALSLDYAVILCNRFKEDYQTLPLREAVIAALSKGIPEIGASSLTTIGGLVAMLFMQFLLGPDMAICLIKSIFFALFSVFVFMPGLLMVFGPWMEKTRHRNLVPKISFVGKFAWATRKVVPLVFLVVAIAAYFVSQNCPYVYGYDTIITPTLNEQQIDEGMIRDTFTSNPVVALVVPAGNYEAERDILDQLDAMPQVARTQGLANTEALDGYCLTDKLTPRQFAELADIDFELSELVYVAYAYEREEYGKLVGGVATYSVPLIDIFLFVWDKVEEGYVTLDPEVYDKLEDAAIQMQNGKVQLQSDNYSRMLVYLALPESGNETYVFTDTIMALARDHYPEGTIHVVGESTNDYEFMKSFARDNVVVNLSSILIVLVVLLFTFNSVAMPVLLIMVIQGAIWINFSVPVFTHVDLFFIAYLIVSAIQMGANIDYAIVIGSRYMEIKDKMDHREAIIETMNFAFPTILTSGSILASAGFILGQISSEGTIVGIGQSLCRGTLISIFLVMFALPQILLVGGELVEKTAFSVGKKHRTHESQGRLRVDGRVRGQIHGEVQGEFHGVVVGEAKLTMFSGKAEEDDHEKA